MATLHWIGGSGSGKNWNSTSGWSTSAGGSSYGAAPTSADDVILDNHEWGGGSLDFGGTVGQAYCRDITLDRIAFSGTITAASGLYIYGSVFGSDVNLQIPNPFFKATTTGKTIDMTVMNGDATFDGVGGGWTLTNPWSTFFDPGGDLILIAGHLDLNGNNMRVQSLFTSGSSTKRLTIGTATLTIRGTSNSELDFSGSNLTVDTFTGQIDFENVFSGSGILTSGGFTLNKVTSVIAITITDSSTITTFSTTGAVTVQAASTFGSFTSSARTIFGAANSFTTLTITGNVHVQCTGNQTVSGTLTLTGTSSTSRMYFYATYISGITLTAATVSLTDVDFDSITAAGAASPFSGTRLGNLDRNSNITFVVSTRYWVGNGGSWNSTTKWSTSSGGSSGASVPLPQDTVVFDANSITSSGQTITFNGLYLGYNLDLSALSNNPTFNFSNPARVYNSVVLNSSMTKNVSFVFTGDRDMELTTASATKVSVDVYLSRLATTDGINYDLDWNGALYLQDALIADPDSCYIYVSGGDFYAQTFDVTTGGYEFYGFSDNTFDMGTGDWVLVYYIYASPNIDTCAIAGSNATLTIQFPSGGSGFDFQLRDGVTNSFGPTVINATGDGDELNFVDSNDIFTYGAYEDLNFTSLTIVGDNLQVTWAATTTYNLGTFVAHGSLGSLLTFVSSWAYDDIENPTIEYRHAYLNATSATVSYIDVTDNFALGDIPFDDSLGGVDSGNNVNWFFGGVFVPQVIMF